MAKANHRKQERYPGMGDGSTCLGRRIYSPGFGRFKDSNGARFPPEPPPPAQMRLEPLPRHIRDYRHKYQQPSVPWKMKDPNGGHVKYTYGIKMSPISRHLNGAVPAHSYSPSLRDAPSPTFRRKSSDITCTDLFDNPNKEHRPCVDPKGWYGRIATDTTVLLRALPKPFDPKEMAPRHGRMTTWITDYNFLDLEMDRLERQKSVPSIPATKLFY